MHFTRGTVWPVESDFRKLCENRKVRTSAAKAARFCVRCVVAEATTYKDCRALTNLE
jgi:hypothetical protein